jgi:hypothetical protein
MKKSRDDSAEVRVYQMKVVLRHVRPPVWRRILVRSDATLAELHHDLQVIMGWTDSHMHSFQAARLFYGMEFLARTVESRDERRTKLSDVLRKVKDKMSYEYDFGDGWTHQIHLEKVEAPAPGGKYPWVITGRRSCPPEDVGGPFGYAHFLAAVQEPQHPEHGELLEWCGGSFDAEKFDAQGVNRTLHGGWGPSAERLTTRSSGRTRTSRPVQRTGRAARRAAERER